MRIHAHIIAMAFAVAAASSPLAYGQVINPTSAVFSPSTDHQTLAPDGTPLVSGYELRFFLQGAAAPFQATALGKPAAAADGLIHVSLTNVLLPSMGIVYEARIAAVGPGGTATSEVSNPFVFAAPCAFAVTPLSAAVPESAASGGAAVTTASTCAWTASTNAAWLTITSGAAGTGAGAVAYTVAANPATSARSGTLTVAGQTVTVIQAARPCTYDVSPTRHDTGAAQTTVSLSVASPAGCVWTAASAASWATVTSGGTRTGPGSVAIAIAANPTTASRSATLIVAGRSIAITQAGQSCSQTVAPLTQTIGASGGPLAAAVTSASGCPWTATTHAAWLVISGGGSGTGSGTLAFDVAANATPAARTGTMTVAGQTLVVTQAAAPSSCSATLTPAAQSVSSNGSSAAVGVSLASSCAWTATSQAAWLTVITGASGTGDGTVVFRTEPNPENTPRTATIVVGAATASVTQLGRSPDGLVKPPKGVRVLRTQ